MGSYCSFSINEYEIDSSKSYINPFMAQIFRESDKRIRRSHYSKHYTQPIEDGTDDVDVIEYAATKTKILDRLELLGYSLQKSIETYDEGIQEAIDNEKEFGFVQDHTLVHLENLKKKGFLSWVEVVRKIIKEEISRFDFDRGRDSSQDDICTFIVDYYSEDFFLGYPSAGYGVALRAILEALDDSDYYKFSSCWVLWQG